ncbi:fasciclin domain-containing protein [Pedobacter frigoris]|uniref:FAS1 domain-containing protein n=1 Tax=Pedobacter frigoris TaxID=2571272 RepID=A0A4U1CEZ4_9SPHI|nr:fasciclin domain-containing protein [Pedobacter frigoris]TKC05131.1 hypothetical protein FA047_15335 [Pedobacter frigoris]
MKNIVYKKSTFFLLGLICLCAGACKKSDSPYYDYVNTVQTFNGTAMDYLKAQPAGTFDSLLLVLDRYPALKTSLTTEELTVFAPVNKNFQAAIKYLNIARKAQGKAPVYLANADEIQLYEMLCKYIVKGKRTTDAYLNSADGSLFDSIEDYPMHIKYTKSSSAGYVKGGPAVLNFSDTKGSIFNIDWVTTTTNAVNIKTNNATINILSAVHNFGFDEFTNRLNN